MKLVDLVREAASQPFQSKDGRPMTLQLEPGLTDDELQTLESELPCPIPADVRELLQFCRGFSGLGYDVCLHDTHAFGHEAFPHPHPVAADGYGNFWIADIERGQWEWPRGVSTNPESTRAGGCWLQEGGWASCLSCIRSSFRTAKQLADLPDERIWRDEREIGSRRELFL